MKKIIFAAVLLTLCVSLVADDSWFIIKPGKMVSGAGFMSMSAGSPKTMVTLGFYKDSQGNDKLEGNFVNDGYNFYPIPQELSGSDIMTQGFLTNTIFMDKENIGGIREKFEGSGMNMTLVTAFVTANIFTMNMFNIVHVFDANLHIAGESLLYRNGTLYVGTDDGQILISSDSGVSWEPHKVSASDEVTISSIFAASNTHFFAAGGSSEDDAMEEKTVVKPLGGVWESTDAGNSWSPLVNDKDFVPVQVIKTESGRIYLKYMTEEELNSDQNPKPTTLGMTDDNFATFTEEVQFTGNTGKTLAGKTSIAYKNGTTWLAGVAGDFSPVTLRSEDEGTTWIEFFLPPLGEGMMVTPDSIYILDERHVYAGFTNTAIAKFGDINEDYSIIPDDDPETTDADTPPVSSDSDTIIETDDNETTDNETVDSGTETPDTEVIKSEGCSTLFI